MLLTADEIIQAALEALELSGGMDVVYLHPDPKGGAVAAIVRIPSKAFDQVAAYAGALEAEDKMLPHDHIEPGMF